MPSSKTDLAVNVTVMVADLPGNPTVLAESVPTELWQGIVTQGTGSDSCRVFFTFHELFPDTDNSANTPFNHGLIAVIEEQQSDGSWEEIGRQNTELRKLSQGASREIYISPLVSSQDEGTDVDTYGFDTVVKKKSLFQDIADNDLRVRLLAADRNPLGAHPFQGVRFSCTVTRFNAVG